VCVSKKGERQTLGRSNGAAKLQNNYSARLKLLYFNTFMYCVYVANANAREKHYAAILLLLLLTIISQISFKPSHLQGERGKKEKEVDSKKLLNKINF
jgi:hypothetical protein